MQSLRVLLLVVFCLTLQVESAKILGIFHFPSKSHHILGSTLLKALAARGHEVTMLSPYPSKHPVKNYEDIDLTGILQYKEDSNLVQTVVEMKQTSLINKMITMSANIDQVNHLFLNHTAVKSLISSKRKFDIIIQMSGFSEAFLGLAHYLGASTIAFSTFGSSVMVNGILQNPAPHSYVPTAFLPLPAEMTFLQRVINTLANVFSEIFYAIYVEPVQERLRQQYLPEAPTVRELLSNVSLVLLNSHYGIESTRPYVPGMIQIGGFHVQEPKELTEDLKQFMDSATDGVLFFSLGSNMRSSDLSIDILQGIVRCFAKLPLKVLWKFEKENVADLPPNVKIGKWLPQRDILGHPNTKLFVTHGGLLSTTEAVYHGVPMVGIPVFGDQEANVAQGVVGGYTVQVDFENLTEEALTNAIKEVLNNPSYRKNIRQRSAILKDQPLKPLDNAIFWIEYVLRHKGAHHLKTSAVKLEWYQYYLLDVAAFLLGIVVFVFTALYLVLRGLIRLLKKVIFKEKQKSLKEKKSKVA